MKSCNAFLLVLPVLVAAPPAPALGAEEPPAWAYPMNPPGLKPSPDDGSLRRVPGSTATFTLTQTRDRYFSPVWHPQEHPPQPEVVARGRKPDVAACGFCHRADGRAARKTRTWRAFPRPISCSSRPTSRREPENLRCPRETSIRSWRCSRPPPTPRWPPRRPIFPR